MQTSVIGFPRIGTLRELKFASEKYFRGEISSQEFLAVSNNSCELISPLKSISEVRLVHRNY